MELLDAIMLTSQASQQASQPTELVLGTVTSALPLEISINNMQAPLRSQVLYLMEPVIEKKIPVLDHIHHINSLSHTHSEYHGTTGSGLTGSYPTLTSLVSTGANSDQTQNIICYEHGKPLPIKDGFIILNRALEVGDKVILLRVQHGQKFIVLSRVFEVS
ncbi:MAG: DUF2577 family protein [Candidatus Metalachnospira sp.]|jgi:hypothetical protein|nr:DUF2577 family protein [Candidatus Metalachnospira sp.]